MRVLRVIGAAGALLPSGTLTGRRRGAYGGFVQAHAPCSSLLVYKHRNAWAHAGAANSRPAPRGSLNCHH